jgi:hypothetical protein
MMATFVRVFAQKVTAEICPVQPFVMPAEFTTYALYAMLFVVKQLYILVK